MPNPTTNTPIPSSDGYMVRRNEAKPNKKYPDKNAILEQRGRVISGPKSAIKVELIGGGNTMVTDPFTGMRRVIRKPTYKISKKVKNVSSAQVFLEGTRQENKVSLLDYMKRHPY